MFHCNLFNIDRYFFISRSAEHGIGQCKQQYLNLNKDNTAIAVMKKMKNMFDPNGILNPGKVLPF